MKQLKARWVCDDCKFDKTCIAQVPRLAANYKWMRRYLWDEYEANPHFKLGHNVTYKEEKS